MEGNKDEAERCRDMGAEALRNGQYSRAVKLLGKSLRLYPLPGVKALMGQAERRLKSEEEQQQKQQQQQQSSNNHHSHSNGSSSSNNSRGRSNFRQSSTSSSSSSQGRSTPRTSNQSTSSTTNNNSSSTTSSSSSSSSRTTTGEAGRNYTPSQLQIVKQILSAKEGGRGAHYRVLGVPSTADDAALKKAYRKLALKLHPDKNSAPQADEAFKAVGLAYATLSDKQKRTIYDRYGEEDPDNRGGGGGGRRGGTAHFNGQEVSPEDVFNMFFGGGMPGQRGGGMGGPGFRVYTTGNGFAFGGMPRQQRRRRRDGDEEEEDGGGGGGIGLGLGQLIQLLPLLVLFLTSFLSSSSSQNQYFSLKKTPTHNNGLTTKLVKVKDIPYFVNDKFIRTYYRDRYQLQQIETMVEKEYKTYLESECKNQILYKRKLEAMAQRKGMTAEDREKQMRRAEEFELGRCVELRELFPKSHMAAYRGW